MIVLPVESWGAIGLVTAIFGVTVPEYRIVVAPDVATPTEKWVIVLEPPVAAGKAIVATGLVEAAEEAVHPPVVLATDCRAYEV